MINLIILFKFSTGMVWSLIIEVVIILIGLFLLYCYYVLAKKRRFFTFAKENKIMYKMNGEKFSGKVILSSKTLAIEKKSYNIIDLSTLPEDKIKKLNLFKNRNIFGMYWVGIYPFRSIYERKQQWLEWKSTPSGREIQFRDEMTPYLVAKPFEYAMLLKEAENKNGMPLNVTFTLILMPKNAVRPIFGNDNAYGQVQTLALAEALMFVKKETFSTLGGKNISVSDEIKDDFANTICGLNKKIPGREVGIIETLGYEILDAKLNSIEIAGEYKGKLQEASVIEYLEQEKAKAEIAKAEGEKQAEIIRSEGARQAEINKAEGRKQAIILEGEANKIAGMLGIDVEKYSMEIRNAFYETIKDKPFAQKIELTKKMFTDSNLKTFVSGKDVLPTINVEEEK